MRQNLVILCLKTTRSCTGNVSKKTIHKFTCTRIHRKNFTSGHRLNCNNKIISTYKLSIRFCFVVPIYLQVFNEHKYLGLQLLKNNPRKGVFDFLGGMGCTRGSIPSLLHCFPIHCIFAPVLQINMKYI